MRSVLLAIACAAGVVSSACPTWVGQPTAYAVGTVVSYNGQNYKVTRTLDNGWITPTDTWFWTSTTETCDATTTSLSGTAKLAAVSVAATAKPTMYVSIEGTKQGKFKGESLLAAFKEKIESWNLAHTVLSPRDAATGLISGKRQHGPIAITKAWGAASPQIFQAWVTNEVLKRVLVEYVQTNAAGVTAVVATVTLTNAYITNITRSTDADGRLVESISFTYQKIELEDKAGSTMAADDWTK